MTDPVIGPVPRGQHYTADGRPTPLWARWLDALQRRAGGTGAVTNETLAVTTIVQPVAQPPAPFSAPQGQSMAAPVAHPPAPCPAAPPVPFPSY